MTACLNILHKGGPLMLTDALISWEGLNLDTLPLPGALVRYSNPTNLQPTQLYRKLYLFGDHLAVACAGTGARIEEFLTEIAGLPAASTGEKALKQIDDVLIRYEPHVQAIVSYQSASEGGMIAPTGSEHSLAPGTKFWVSGSGGDEMAGIVQYDFDRFDRSRLHTISPPDLLRNVAGRAGSRIIGNELVHGTGKDWGGIAEWATFNFYLNKWEYSPPNLHGFIIGVPLPGKRFTLAQTGYWYCYNNDAELGSSAVLGMRLRDQPYVVQWTLENIPPFEMAKERTIADWIGWQPVEIVVQVFPYGRRELGSLFCMTGVLPELSFDIQQNGIVAEITQSRIDDWGAAAAGGWRREYVPSTSFSDAEMEAAYEAAMTDGWSS